MIEKLESTARLRLDPTIVPVVVNEDAVQFRAGPWAGPIVTLRDESRDGTLASVVREIDRGASISDIVATVEGVDENDIRQVLTEVDSKNLLRRVDGDHERDRSPLPLRFAVEDLAALSSTSVLVVASGATGPAVVKALDRAGVGELHVRHRRSESAGRAFSAAVSVEPWEGRSDTIETALDGVDLALGVSRRPWPGATSRLNRLAIDAGTPVAYAQITGYDVVVGPTVFPGETACYECYQTRRNRNIGSPETYAAFERAGAARDGGAADRLPFTEIAVGFLATDVINVLCYGHGYTVGSVVTFDMSTLSMESNDVLRLPRCEQCSEIATDIGYDSLFAPEDLATK